MFLHTVALYKYQGSTSTRSAHGLSTGQTYLASLDAVFFKSALQRSHSNFDCVVENKCSLLSVL